MQKTRINLIVAIALSLCSLTVLADDFPMPSAHENLVGEVREVISQPGDDFSRLGRRYDVGYYQLIEANPGLDPDEVLPTGTKVVVPSQYLLPPVPRKGIVINLAELRLYYFNSDSNIVTTHPVGIGRQGWNTPVGVTKIVSKTVNPTWVVPPDIRAARAAEGINLPVSMPPGVDNPLGAFRMRLALPSYLIHGTNDASGVGRRSSSGCIRMLPEDVESFYEMVTIGTPVQIIDNPYKVVWSGDNLYLEAHIPTQENSQKNVNAMSVVRKLIEVALKQRMGQINWDAVNTTVNTHNGIPTIIGVATSTGQN